MAIYELRTYTVTVGKMNDVVSLYNAEDWKAWGHKSLGSKAWNQVFRYHIEGRE